ncbi:MAG: ABC transporter ATP-binding protein [Clostridia bacterium]|nr:ABC transporter ATP-binding protein [Clostridia bacterium]
MVLEVKNISKVFGSRNVLSNVSFSVDRGEIMGFIGPNGAGKTTAIKVILGLLRPADGNVLINGFDVAKNHDKALESVGAIIESPELYPYLSGRENLMQFARIHGVGEERVRECVEIVGLSARIDEKVRKYSLGMRQRLGVAQAILNRPSLLILDEPTNGLDPSGIKELRDMLKMLASQGTAILVSSHLLSELEQVCTSACIIEKGVIIGVQKLDNFVGETAPELEPVNTYAFTVGNIEAAATLLQQKGYQFDIIDNLLFVNSIRSKIPTAVSVLVGEGIELFALEPRKKTLEESYLEVTSNSI